MGSIKPEFTEAQYFRARSGYYRGGYCCLAAVTDLQFIHVRIAGPYFAIGSLGLAIAAVEITITIDYVGGPSGISMPLFPGDIEFRSTFFTYLLFYRGGTFS